MIVPKNFKIVHTHLNWIYDQIEPRGLGRYENGFWKFPVFGSVFGNGKHQSEYLWKRRQIWIFLLRTRNEYDKASIRWKTRIGRKLLRKWIWIFVSRNWEQITFHIQLISFSIIYSKYSDLYSLWRWLVEWSFFFHSGTLDISFSCLVTFFIILIGHAILNYRWI